MGLVDQLIDAGILSREHENILPNTNDLEKIDFAIEAGLIAEKDYYSFLAKKHNMKFCNLNQTLINEELIAEKNNDKRFLTLREDEINVTVALSDPEDILLLDKILRQYSNKHVEFLIVPKSQIDRCYKACVLDKDMQGLYLREAIRSRASDVHFNPGDKNIVVKFRISGILEDRFIILRKDWDRIKRKLKILADLDIAETRVPQSGHAMLTLPEKTVHLRVSTHPGIFGEAVTIRVLDVETQLLDLDELGFDQYVLDKIRKRMLYTSGLFLIAGPTGSGKTTTLYAILNALKEKNIMTLEDPVELRIPGIKQLDVKEENLISFSDGIKSILRHDPDIILIGEIRDSETAKMALRAALTGKLVFTTIHAIDCVGAVHRLMELGLAYNDIIKNFSLIMSQRLLQLVKDKYKRLPVAEILDFDNCQSNFLDIALLETYIPKEKKLINVAKNLLNNGVITKDSFLNVFGTSDR